MRYPEIKSMNATLFHTKAAFYRTASASEAGKPGFRNGMVRIRKRYGLFFRLFSSLCLMEFLPLLAQLASRKDESI